MFSCFEVQSNLDEGCESRIYLQSNMEMLNSVGKLFKNVFKFSAEMTMLSN